MVDLDLHDIVSYQEPNGGPVRTGEVKGINHINIFIRYGPGPNEVKFIPWKTCSDFNLEIVEKAVLPCVSA